ncbi:hypothetical protein A3Q56_02865 [Intoshia linei]|uniref:LisH domain-containing protein n=1 Tax=Intoshia linei TaxID=1819745 RepID=A0A177B4Y9_9BILA|nr:hypothetical protein A3Q56_02865 [Intoshia linei]
MLDSGLAEEMIKIFTQYLDNRFLTSYTLDYASSLLMNISLQFYGRQKFSNHALKIMKILKELLGKNAISKYIHASIYGLLTRSTFKTASREINLKEKIYSLIDKSNPQHQKQLNYIIQLIQKEDSITNEDDFDYKSIKNSDDDYDENDDNEKEDATVLENVINADNDLATTCSETKMFGYTLLKSIYMKNEDMSNYEKGDSTDFSELEATMMQTSDLTEKNSLNSDNISDVSNNSLHYVSSQIVPSHSNSNLQNFISLDLKQDLKIHLDDSKTNSLSLDTHNEFLNIKQFNDQTQDKCPTKIKNVLNNFDKKIVKSACGSSKLKKLKNQIPIIARSVSLSSSNAVNYDQVDIKSAQNDMYNKNTQLSLSYIIIPQNENIQEIIQLITINNEKQVKENIFSDNFALRNYSFVPGFDVAKFDAFIKTFSTKQFDGPLSLKIKIMNGSMVADFTIYSSVISKMRQYNKINESNTLVKFVDKKKATLICITCPICFSLTQLATMDISLLPTNPILDRLLHVMDKSTPNSIFQQFPLLKRSTVDRLSMNVSSYLNLMAHNDTIKINKKLCKKSTCKEIFLCENCNFKIFKKVYAKFYCNNCKITCVSNVTKLMLG